jgi:hypothetical protein
MNDDLSGRSRNVLVLILAMVLLLFAAGCGSASDADSSSAAGDTSAVTSAAPTTGPPQKICGTPPCVRFVSRGDTKTLSSTLNDHPIISAVAVHVAVGILCGGILCLLGEGVSTTYVDHAARDAASQHACLMVRLLPDSDKWKLVNLSASNQSPYCKD